MALPQKKIAVFVSLFGKCSYLKAFLDSLSRQSFQDFRLFYRIDGAIPQECRALLREYPFAEQRGDERHLGIPATYWELLSAVQEYDFLMFADQDDLWHPDKIERSFAELREMENQYGKETPLLVHSDLTVVDAQDKVISASFIRYQSLNPHCCRLKDLMIQNNVTGCTMIFNRALAERIKTPVPAICHDWYMALTAAAFGQIRFIPDSLIDYRQHDSNHYGAVPPLRLSSDILNRKKLHARIVLTQKQALCFLHEFRSELSPEQIQILEAWSTLLQERSYFKRLAVVSRYKFRKNDCLRTLGMWWAL